MKFPVQLGSYALKYKYFRPLHLYMGLKFRTNNVFKIDDTLLSVIASDLMLKSHKTIKANLGILIRLNWIGHNPRTGNYFLRSYDKVREMYGFNSRSSVEIGLSDIKTFRAFISGAIISNLVNISRRRALARERNLGCSLHRTNKLPDFFPVANLALSKMLNISISTAWELKRLAHKEGYIILKHNLKELKVDDLKLSREYTEGLVNEIQLISAEHCPTIKKAFPESRERIRVRANHLWLQTPDTVKSQMHFKRRRKLTLILSK